VGLKQAGLLLGIREHTVRKLANLGTILPVRFGRRVLVSMQTLDYVRGTKSRLSESIKTEQPTFQNHMFPEHSNSRVSVQTNQWFPDAPRDRFLERMV
jgi:hypothetical protein